MAKRAGRNASAPVAAAPASSARRLVFRSIFPLMTSLPLLVSVPLWSILISLKRAARAQLEALDLAGGRLRHLFDELDPARIFEMRQARLHMLLQLQRERRRGGNTRLQDDIGLGLRELLLVELADDGGFEH